MKQLWKMCLVVALVIVTGLIGYGWTTGEEEQLLNIVACIASKQAMGPMSGMLMLLRGKSMLEVQRTVGKMTETTTNPF